MNDNLQYKSRNELEQLCKQFNINTLGLKKEDLLIELRFKLLYVNDLPRSPHRPYRSSEGIPSSKKKKSAQKVLSKSASMGRTVSHLQDQFEEQAWQAKVVRSVSDLEQDDKLKDDTEISKNDSNGVPEVKKATSILLETEEQEIHSSENTITGADADLEISSPSSKSGATGVVIDSPEGKPNLELRSTGEVQTAPSEISDTASETSDSSGDDDIVFEYPGKSPPYDTLSTPGQDYLDGYPILEDKEMLDHVVRPGSLGLGWVKTSLSRLHSASSMTVEVGDNPPAEYLSVPSEIEKETGTPDTDTSNKFDGKDNADLEDFIEFKIIDNADVYMSLMDKKLEHQVVKDGTAGNTVINKSPSRLHSMNSMFVEVGDNPPAESESLLGPEAEDRASFQDLDTFDGYEVTVVEDAASPWKSTGENYNAGQSAATESSCPHSGQTSVVEITAETPSDPESSLEDFVHDAHQGSKTTFVSEWAANNLRSSTIDADKEQSCQEGGNSIVEVGLPFSLVLWCSTLCSRLPGTPKQPS